MPKILIVDDEKEIVTLLRLYLETNGIEVMEAYDGEQAYEIIEKGGIDLALVDVMMPKMNGFELIKKVREKQEIPILVISARTGLNDRVLGLDLGADDYILKPFETLEVVAKVRAHLRRQSQYERSKIEVGDLVLDIAECRILIGDTAYSLTKAEFFVLKKLMEHPGRVFTKEQIYDAGWNSSYGVDDNTIRVIICRIRDKIGEEKIQTIRGLGYRLVKNG